MFEILLSIALPAVIAGLAVLALRRAVGGDEKRGYALGAALGLAVGFTVGQIVTIGWPGLLPVDANYRLPHAALAAAAAGAFELFWKGRPLVLWVLRGAVGAVLVTLLLRSLLEHTWEGAQGVFWMSGVFGAFLFFLHQLTALCKKTKGISFPLLTVLLASAGSIALVLSHSALLGQLSGSLAAGIGAVGALAFFRPGISLHPAGVPVAATILAGLWMCGYFFASLPAESACALLLSPSFALLGGAGPLKGRPDWQVLALRILLLSVPAGLAVYWALAASEGGGSDYYDY